MNRTGRRPGASTTREEILTAAAEAFSTGGYEATSMRQVAAVAGVDPALVRRFFGGKEQLFAAAVSEVFQPEHAVAMLLDGPRGRLGERLVTYVLGLLGEVERPGPLLGLMRSAATSEPAAALIRTFLAEEMLGRVTSKLGVDHPDLRAALAAGQLVGLVISRYAVRLDALVAAGPAELTGWVAPVLQRYLTGRAPVVGDGEEVNA
ncbi:TetR/AcrR family transcriptional regulator [Nonomuraea gerenzanensis]|uniref:Transcriptional regulator, TetR family n=1 Tax=Nonomuraea gerenzanensis TaxID=93944 RepID=A0A1M4E7I0_9ACTN|nr:TetR family transcriptional regulator [Nonomuraea gerenzanensis]UBU17096.1 TetR family transcriptional regulator [Nonomuraea gerenzanensis]SBO94831.1 Transcriptional regulator, TetR family [Nonomuraea gerenzanensis]